jgi:hypothetical protein
LVALAALIFCGLALPACKKSQPTRDTVASASLPSAVAAAAPSVVAIRLTIVRISAFADGKLQVDGAAMTPDEAISVLSGLDAPNSIVWYYREAPKEPPHPSVQRVVQAIAEFGIPVSLSTQPDFSDVVDKDGQVRPRQKPPQ